MTRAKESKQQAHTYNKLLESIVCLHLIVYLPSDSFLKIVEGPVKPRGAISTVYCKYPVREHRQTNQSSKVTEEDAQSASAKRKQVPRD